jgi:bacillithiol system protein YtxJ
MENHFVKVRDLNALEDLTTRSNEAPVVIFKHSTTCSISAAAYSEMTRVAGDVALVEVQSARDVSGAIETRTGVEHASPQVIVLRNGKPVWHASHWRISAEAVDEAVSEYSK